MTANANMQQVSIGKAPPARMAIEELTTGEAAHLMGMTPRQIRAYEKRRRLWGRGGCKPFCHTLSAMERLSGLLTFLPERLREVLRAVYLRGESQETLARRWGVNQACVDCLHDRAVELLQRQAGEQSLPSGEMLRVS